jgi:fumarylacetoacetase
MIDATHDAGLKSWVAGADGHPDFPIQNLPLGVFLPPGGTPRGGVAIGDAILDLGVAVSAGLLPAEPGFALAAQAPLNAFLGLGSGPRRALRAALSALLDARSPLRSRAEATGGLLHRAADCAMHLPVRVGDYTDFYAGINHAVNVGRLMRPDNPLMPNYKHVPIGYHGRASSIVPSRTPVRRPTGQRNRPDSPTPLFAPSARLDYELELAVWIGPGNALGEPIPIAAAGEHIAGFGLLNDWSARDIQGWEYQPLGPFLGKNFFTTVSPWIVTPEALAPFRVAQGPRPNGDPQPLPYLADPADQASGALDLALEVTLLTPAMAEMGLPPHVLSRGTARDLYWTVAQMVAHHSCNGCNLQPGDLFGTGTISGTEPGSWGSLLEITRGNKEPVTLPNGETRGFLQDGDTVTLAARAHREGFASIGFGPCTGTVVPAAF